MALDLSIVVPVYDEAESLEPLHEEIRDAVGRLGQDYEIIFVDDGSRDGSFRVARRLAQRYRRVRVVRLKRNYGQTAAIQAGFDQSTGRVVVVLDADLQNDPADIELLIAGIDAGYDVVSGWRKNRTGNVFTRRLPSWVANSLTRWITGVKIHDNGCSLKAYRREVIERAWLLSDSHRFILPLMAMSGCSYKEVVVHHRRRRFGRSKYGLSRTWGVTLDLIRLAMITRCSARPGLWFGLMSVPPLLLAGVCFAAAIAQYLRAAALVEFPLIYAGSAVLFTYAFGHLVLMAAIGELAVWAGDVKELDAALIRTPEAAEGPR